MEDVPRNYIEQEFNSIKNNDSALITMATNPRWKMGYTGP